MNLLSVAEILQLVADGSVSIVEKPWGSEYLIATPEFIIKLIKINDGHRTSLQRHNVKTEVIHVISGSGGVEVYPQANAITMHSFGPTFIGEGERVHIMPGEIHRSIGPVTLLEITTPENDDIVRISDDYQRNS